MRTIPMSAVRSFGRLLPLALCLIVPGAVPAGEGKWIDLSRSFDVWKGPTRDLMFAGSVVLDPEGPTRRASEPGMGSLVNSPKGRAHDLVTRQEFGDVEVHVEFLIPRGSNSGVKLQGQYEVQILDSYGRKKLTGDDCGGIYPRAEQKPRYHHLDKGVAPRVNAARPAGEW